MKTFCNTKPTYKQTNIGLYEIWFYKECDDGHCGSTSYLTTWSGRWLPTFWGGKFCLCLPSEDPDIVFN